MIFRYKKNFVDTTATKCDDIEALTKVKKRPPEFSNPTVELKPKFKEWCGKPTTDHAFITLCTGDNPNFPISADNPVRELHGLIADYDAKPDNDDWMKIIDINCGDGLRPTYISKSFSGYPRLVWLWDKSVLTTDNTFAALYKRLDVKLKVTTMFPEWDEACLNASQTYEIGTEWQKIGEPIPHDVVLGASYAASAETPERTNGPEIPFDVIYDKIQENYPDRLDVAKDDFGPGLRLAAFMVDPFKPESDSCCVVHEEGIHCFTTRAPKAFYSWSDLFGREFVKNYEEDRITGILRKYWTNGEKYFKRNDLGTIEKINKQQLELELKIAGFRPRKDRTTGVSELDIAIDRINVLNRIDCIAPIIFSKEEMIIFEGKRILNDSRLNILKAAENGDPKNFPYIDNFFKQFFDKDTEVDQKHALFSWLHVARKSLMVGDHRKIIQSLCLIISGGPGVGKSLTSGGIISPLLGGSAPASRFLSGKTPFNSELAHYGCWIQDDNVNAGSQVDQKRMDETVKASIANRYLNWEAKYFEPSKIPYSPKLVMTLNTDPASMASVPNLDQATADKLLGLVVSEKATIDFPDDLEDILEKELPFFAKFIDDYVIPASLKGTQRYGVKPYIHPQIARATYDNSRKAHVSELVDIFIEGIRDTYPDPSTKDFSNEWWSGTVTAFQKQFLANNGNAHFGCSAHIDSIKEGLQNIVQQSKMDDDIRPIRSISSGSGTRFSISLSRKYDFCEENTSAEESLEV
tara:strand:+ start:928 stop:3171 length:2244 start_codon:yes stop_codon:yes gene_type:complete